MSDSVVNISEKYGMPPGSLVHVGNVAEAESRMSIIDYSKANIEEQSIKSISEILPYIDKDTVTWLNVEG
jgi:magnesium transporter